MINVMDALSRGSDMQFISVASNSYNNLISFTFIWALKIGIIE